MKTRIEVSSRFLARPLSKSGEADILSAGDRLDMIDLLSTVAWCIDAADFTVLATITTEDFVYDHPLGVVRGRDQFIEFLKANSERFAGCRTTNISHLVRSVDLSNSIVASHIIITKVCDAQGKVGADLPGIVGHGMCTDDLRKEKEIWKMARRTIDQMSLAESLAADAATRSLFSLTAAERNQPVTK